MSSGAAPADLAGLAPSGARGPDERLARRAANGDEAAFAAIYRRYHQRLFRYCVSILRDETDAQDALQSTFERAFCALRQDQRNAPLRPWLFRIAHNEAVTVIRRRPREPVEARVGPPCARSAEHEADARDRLALLVADLAELPERPRSALIMRELEGLSHEEIAIALATSVGAAKQTIFEARRALGEAAEGRDMSCDEIRRQISDGDRRVLRGRRMRTHLRSCRGCADFAAAIPTRRADLRALAPPLAPVAATSLLARIFVSQPAHGHWSGAAAAAGKGGLTGAVGSKLATGAAVVATAAAGTAGVAAVEPLVVGHPAHSRGAASRSARSRSVAARAVAPSAPWSPARAPAGPADARAAVVAHGGHVGGATSPVRGASVRAAARTKSTHSAASASNGHGRGQGGGVRTTTGSAGASAHGRAVGHSHSATASAHSGGGASQAPGRLKHAKSPPGKAQTSPGHARLSPPVLPPPAHVQTGRGNGPRVVPGRALGKQRPSTP